MANNRFLKYDGFGTAFYPDQLPRETWARYIDLMADAKISFVRMSEFAWDKLEPEEGVYDFSLFDEALELLAKKNIRAIMSTPGATPPAWMVDKYHFYPLKADGREHRFGGRQYVCPNSADFREKITALTIRMAEHYADDPRVCGWQVDNEVGFPFCFCPVCQKKFQAFLQRKFKTVENLNRALGLHFWGQTVQRFDQLPMPTDSGHSAMWLQYHYFFSESLIDCFGGLGDLLRRHGVHVPISSNSMLTWYGYDHEQMAKHWDYCTGDYYFGGDLFGGDLFAIAFCAAYLRGMKQGTPPRFNEFRGGRIGGIPMPGEIRYHALAAIAAGADHLCFFRWDTFPSGNERNNWGVIRSLELPGRSYEEVKKLTRELQVYQAFLDGSAPPPPRTALLYSYETHYDTAEIQAEYPRMTEKFGNGYAQQLSRQFRALLELGENPDILFQGGDFSRYRVIIVSAMLVLTDTAAQKLRAFVANGGILLMLPSSAVYDENGQMFANGVPGPLADVFGTACVDYGRIEPDLKMNVTFDNARSLPVTDWAEEIIAAPGTSVLGRYTAPLANTPAFTSRRYGAGMAFQLGIFPGTEQELVDFYRDFYRRNQLAVSRRGDDGEFRFSRCKDGKILDFIFCPVTREVRIELRETYLG